MPLIWCSISGHGYGHAAQVVPVLNALGRLVPNLSAILRTSVPADFFEPRLDIPWQLKVGQQDIGCIQDGPLKIDVSRTWAAHSVLHSDWQQKIEAEAALIRSAGPACVLSDISHLGIAAGAATGIPTIGLCSLSWDLVLEPFADPVRCEHATILRQIREAYAKADCFLRVAPALAITAFHPVREIGPIAEPAVLNPRRSVRPSAPGSLNGSCWSGSAALPCERFLRTHGGDGRLSFRCGWRRAKWTDSRPIAGLPGHDL